MARRGWRGGHASWAAVGTVAAAGALIAVGAFTFPNAIDAGPSASWHESETVRPQELEHARSMEALRLLLTQSHALLAHHAATRDDQQQIVLWYSDADGDGGVAVGEVLVLSFHGTTGSLAASSWESGTGGLDRGALDLVRADVLAQREFARRWVLRREVNSRVIVTGLSSFTLEPSVEGEGEGVWRVGLRWRADPADGGEEDAPVGDYGSMTIDLTSTRRGAPSNGGP